MMTLAAEQLAAISRLFSSSVIRELARRGQSPIFARLARQSRLVVPSSASTYVHSFFDTAFALLKREGYRHEYIYKAAITHNILLGTYSLKTASMLNEFRVGECKADIAIFNGTATVYEVKSERDSLSRLERQIAAYSKVFASIYVVAAENHIDTVRQMVPRDVGVLLLNKRHQITRLQNAANKPERTSPESIFESIRTDEARAILRANAIPLPDLPNTMMRAALRELFVRLDARKAHEGMVRTLKKTRNLLPLSELLDRLPLSLQPAALSMPLRKLDHMRLVNAVNTPLAEAMAWA